MESSRKLKSRGGPPQTLCDAELGEGGTWNSDGVIVFAPAPGTGLLRVSASGGEPTAVTKLDTSKKETSHRWPHFLPDRKRFIFLAQPGTGHFSPDGRWVAYRSNESGEGEIYVAPFPGPGEKIRISSTGAAGGYPRWRRDGKELFYLASDRTLVAVPVDGQGSKFEAGVAKSLFQTRPSLGRDPFDVSPDGKRFLILTTPQETADEVVTVVLNWTAALKK